MARPPANPNCTEIWYPWFWDILNEFTETHPIPKSWGGDTYHGYETAGWLMKLAVDLKAGCDSHGHDADLFEEFSYPLSGTLSEGSILGSWTALLIHLFFREPDYFLALLAFTRFKFSSLFTVKTVTTRVTVSTRPRAFDTTKENVTSLNKTELIAALLDKEEYELTQADDGRVLGIKETLALLEKRGISADFSTVGKARNHLARVGKLTEWLLDKGHPQPLSSNGEPLTDEEMVEYFDDKPTFELTKLTTSEVRKARRRLERGEIFADYKVKNERVGEAANRKALDAYEVYKKTAECRSWYEQRRQEEYRWTRLDKRELMEIDKRYREEMVREFSGSRMVDPLFYEESSPPRNVYPGSFDGPLEGNEELKRWFLKQYIRYGTTPRPHEAPPLEDKSETERNEKLARANLRVLIRRGAATLLKRRDELAPNDGRLWDEEIASYLAKHLAFKVEANPDMITEAKRLLYEHKGACRWEALGREAFEKYKSLVKTQAFKKWYGKIRTMERETVAGGGELFRFGPFTVPPLLNAALIENHRFHYVNRGEIEFRPHEAYANGKGLINRSRKPPGANVE